MSRLAVQVPSCGGEIYTLDWDEFKDRHVDSILETMLMFLDPEMIETLYLKIPEHVKLSSLSSNRIKDNIQEGSMVLLLTYRELLFMQEREAREAEARRQQELSAERFRVEMLNRPKYVPVEPVRSQRDRSHVMAQEMARDARAIPALKHRQVKEAKRDRRCERVAARGIL